MRVGNLEYTKLTYSEVANDLIRYLRLERFALLSSQILADGKVRFDALYTSGAEVTDRIQKTQAISQLRSGEDRGNINLSPDMWAIPVLTRDLDSVWLIVIEPEGSLLQRIGDLSSADFVATSSLDRHLKKRFQSQLEELEMVSSLGLEIADSEDFATSVFSVCDYLKNTFRLNRVFFAWCFSPNKIKIMGGDNGAQVDKNTELYHSLKLAMEECFDQNDEVILPTLPNSNTIDREHNNNKNIIGSDHLISLPLRINDRVVGVIITEYPKFEEEKRSSLALKLRIALDLVTPVLHSSYQREVGIFQFFRNKCYCGIKIITGPKFLGIKFLVILLVLLVVILSIIPWKYRVTGEFSLESSAQANISVPFNSTIESVTVSVGDDVLLGQELLHLDTDALRLEQAKAKAERSQYLQKVQEAMANKQLSEMRQHSLAVEQIDAKLDFIEYQLKSAVIVSPFSGILVEGDLSSQLKAPVEKGQILMRIVKVDSLYFKLKIDEKDIHFIDGNALGQIAFKSRPNDKFDIQLVDSIPVAVTDEKGVSFIIEATTDQEMDWWRPGMTGVCKVDVGYRPLIWVMTHRTMQYLRLKLWF